MGQQVLSYNVKSVDEVGRWGQGPPRSFSCHFCTSPIH